MLFEAWNAHDVQGFAALFSDDYFSESDTLPVPVRGPQAAAEFACMYWNASPDSKIEIDSLYDTGDHVIARWRVVGTHRREFMGISATNKKIDVTGCAVIEVKHVCNLRITFRPFPMSLAESPVAELRARCFISRWLQRHASIEIQENACELDP